MRSRVTWGLLALLYDVAKYVVTVRAAGGTRREYS
jgi:hypothetical protein